MVHLRSSSPTLHDETIRELHTAVQQASRVTVEFGTAMNPLFESQWMNQFDADNLYIGTNIDSLQHLRLAEKIGSICGFALFSPLAEGSIEPLPLPDQSIDTVYMANVLGEPDSNHIMYHLWQSDGNYYGSSSVESKFQTLREARRILKPLGELVILENNTPYNIRSRREAYQLLVPELVDTGFVITSARDRTNPDWEQEASKYAAIENWWSEGSYLVTAQPA